MAHGFHRDTLIKCADDMGWWQMGQLVSCSEKGAKKYVTSFNEQTQKWCPNLVKRGAHGRTNCYCRLSFGKGIPDLICAPTQLFYNPVDRQWVVAYLLKQSDPLLCHNNNIAYVTSNTLIEQKLNIYSVEVENAHTFLVGSQSIVAHNMIVPIAISIGVSVPFGCGGGASAGAFFGPIGFAGGIVVGGLIGVIVSAAVRHSSITYDLSFGKKDLVLFMESASEENTSVKIKTIDDIISNAQPGEVKRFSKQFNKEGGYQEALEDFESLGPSNVKDISQDKVGKIGILPDGRRVNVRLDSSDSRPTLEIQSVDAKNKAIKIRYGDKG